mmetsp:Transcript_23378/g.28126  ORF Transcript_23378/g.28126 Transcript_23378/m.28126 type:complete len:157 (-) Transcript_23378:158-628(-)
MMKNLSLVLLSALSSTSLGWITQVGPCRHQIPIAGFAMRNSASLGYAHSRRFMSIDEEMPEEMNIPASAELKTDDPCWQNFYGEDDDCGMSSVYAANFVPSKWIKSMPCGEGIEDCDMPKALNHPGSHAMDDVDVMGFLGLKKAAPVDTGTEGKAP